MWTSCAFLVLFISCFCLNSTEASWDMNKRGYSVRANILVFFVKMSTKQVNSQSQKSFCFVVFWFQWFLFNFSGINIENVLKKCQMYLAFVLSFWVFNSFCFRTETWSIYLINKCVLVLNLIKWPNFEISLTLSCSNQEFFWDICLLVPTTKCKQMISLLQP